MSPFSTFSPFTVTSPPSLLTTTPSAILRSTFPEMTSMRSPSAAPESFSFISSEVPTKNTASSPALVYPAAALLSSMRLASGATEKVPPEITALSASAVFVIFPLNTPSFMATSPLSMTSMSPVTVPPLKVTLVEGISSSPI